MDKFDSHKFLGSVRHLNRDLGSIVIDKQALYSHQQTHADDAQHVLLEKVKERNKRYIEQRRRKQEQQAYTETSLTHNSSKILETTSTAFPTQHSTSTISTQMHQARPHLNMSKVNHMANTFMNRTASTKSQLSFVGGFHETQEIPTPLSVTKQQFHLPLPRRLRVSIHPNMSSEHLNSNQTMRTIQDSNLPSATMNLSLKSPLLRSSANRSNRRQHQFRSPLLKHESTDLNMLRSMDKKYHIAKRFVDATAASGRDLAMSTERGDMISEERRAQTRHCIDEYYRNASDMLEAARDAIDWASQSRKDKIGLDKYLTEVVNCAQKSHNLEFYLAALKTQAKVLIKYNDLYRAIGNFKTIKRISDNNIDPKQKDSPATKNYLVHKLSAYKNLGRCFQEIQNHKMAIFYYVKMLQTAWVLNSRRKELVAYDSLGLQYYYMGELENAHFYHEKMMVGNIERQASDLRELGIEKLMANIQDKHQNKHKIRYRNIKSIEDELNSTSNPPSEDEFELPEPLRQKFNKDNADKQDFAVTTQRSKRKVHVIPLTRAQQNKSTGRGGLNRSNTLNSSVTQGFNQSLNDSKITLESVSHPPKPLIYLSHLSPNRFLKNFHNADTKDIVNAYVTTESLGGGVKSRTVILDYKSLEEIRLKLEQLKTNVQMAKVEIDAMIEGNVEVEVPKKRSVTSIRQNIRREVSSKNLRNT